MNFCENYDIECVFFHSDWMVICLFVSTTLPSHCAALTMAKGQHTHTIHTLSNTRAHIFP